MEKFSKRTLRVTKEHNEECKRLLLLLGIPILDAPCEAEAQCAELCKAGRVYAVATEDMDCLTFGTVRQARHMMAPASQKKEVQEFEVDKVIEGLSITFEQFVDLCMLCGCDYLGKIRGIGPVKALSLIKTHGSIEAILDARKKQGQPTEEAFENNYKAARELFKKPVVTPAAEVPKFTWVEPDEEGLVRFLVEEKGFNKERVISVVKKVKAYRAKGGQARLDSFFGAPRATAKSKPAQKPFGKSTGVKKKKSSGIRLGSQN